MAFQRSKVPGEDIRLAMEMTQKRRQLIEESPADPIVWEYGVNRLAASLHPGFVKAKLCSREPVCADCYRITFKSLREDGHFPYFRAGQFVTLSARVGDSFLTRPYSIASSPKRAMAGELEIIVRKTGIFSSWLTEEAPVGTELLMGEPSGDFCHDSIRDKEHIVGIAGGTGAAPFLSMMRAITEGSEDFRLTLLYGARTREQILFDPEEFRDDRIRIETVLSDEEAEGYRHGFISADILKEYVTADSTVFLCGPDAMYAYVLGELGKLEEAPAGIRQERNPVGNRILEKPETFRLTVRIRDNVKTIDARSEETLITALERAGIPAVVRCRSGVCGFCHSRLVSGECYIAPENDFRRAADRKFGYIHPCSAYPMSDVEIEIPIFDAEE
ncbi:MAG: 2Fe-2S iron-sulfur cluster binding domain-containing protein [Oscillospiraceae bacterium]|nr:2Fe-2S iron-sulfur cluster binding domain-containing protein [Oscillospiraceae bacterium]